MTIKEAAKRANVHPKTIRRWIESGHLISEKVQGHNGQEHSIKEEDLAAIIGAPSPSPKRSPMGGGQAVLEERIKGLERLVQTLEREVAEKSQLLEQKDDYVRALLTTNASLAQKSALPSSEDQKQSLWRRLGFKGGDK